MKELQKYLKLNYPTEVRWISRQRVYFVKIPDLPGCMAHGETLETAFKALEDAKRCWFESALEDGSPIPAPSERLQPISPRGKAA